MKFIADLHIHSKYSRATSPQMDLENIDKIASQKGIKVMGAGDFTHPLWVKELKTKLVPAEHGLFRLKSARGSRADDATRFMLTSEISCIYSKGGKVRKIHMLIFAPDFKTIDAINNRLNQIGNLKADGRPILGLDAKELVKIALNASKDCFVAPGHIYTPWFALFGSKSGFDSLEECFEDYSKYIYAGETGLSSDPSASWRNSGLDKIALISNSDAHSLAKIGREANVFDAELSYKGITEAIKQRNPAKFLYTIEFFPQEGKYHYDGHRDCNISMTPKETKKRSGLCPVCGKPLTVGVLSRVEDLADREEGFKPKGAVGYKNLIPLQEIISEALGVGVGSKKVAGYYDKITASLGSELDILLNIPASDLNSATLPEIAEGIIRVRQGKVNVEPGYDGVYGKISIFRPDEKRNFSSQKSLF